MIELNKYKLKPEQYVFAYEQILLLRRFEEKCGQLYGMGMIGGFCHLYIGQEAVIIGVKLAMNQNDSTITSYRDHAHMIVTGTEPKYVLAELVGKSAGCSKGKGGSMHMFNVAGKFYGGHGIVGAQVPIGTGLAFAEKYNNTDNICFTFLGDGAINQGQVYEAFNMAALWRLPVIYIIENNEYSMGTSVERSTAQVDLYKKGNSFGIPGFKVNGMDVEEVYSAVKQAAQFARDKGGPVILEMKTYRYRGHSMSDPGNYRTKIEVEKYKEQDPLIKIKDKILAEAYISEQNIKDIDKKVKNIIAEAVEFAQDAALPEESELYSNVYHEN